MKSFPSVSVKVLLSAKQMHWETLIMELLASRKVGSNA